MLTSPNFPKFRASILQHLRSQLQSWQQKYLLVESQEHSATKQFTFQLRELAQLSGYHLICPTHQVNFKHRGVRVVIWFNAGILSLQHGFDSCPGKNHRIKKPTKTTSGPF